MNLSLQVIAYEALSRFVDRTGQYRCITVLHPDNKDGWYRVESSKHKDAPSLEFVWPYGDNLTLDQAKPLIDALLDEHDLLAWESSIEARLERGALAYQCASENFAVDLYRRVHL